MDCEKLDRVLMDLLYDELDELTRASALRHCDHCQRCRELLHGLRATREVGILPLVEPSEGFEARILEQERLAHQRLPMTQRLLRALTIASGYAMRPQLAMAALLLLMIGSSLVLLRPRPGAHSNSMVTERGVPRSEPETVVVPVIEPSPAAKAAEPDPAPVARAAAPAASAKPAAEVEREMDLASQKAEEHAYAEAMSAYQEQRYLEAQKQFDSIVESQGRNAASAELYAALAAEAVQGCAAALPRFDSVAARNPDTDLGHTATWRSATCRAQLGQERRATLDLQKLLAVPAYSARAKVALGQLALGAGEAVAVAEKRAAEEEVVLEPPLAGGSAGKGSIGAGAVPGASIAADERVATKSEAAAEEARSARSRPEAKPAAAASPAKAKLKPKADTKPAAPSAAPAATPR
jgi:hypothetical protein